MPKRTYRNPYEPGEAKMLSELYKQARTVRGTTPVDDPARKAAKAFVNIIADRREAIDPPYTYFELGHYLDVPNAKGETGPMDDNTLRFFLARHGKEKLPPKSAHAAVKNTSTNKRHRTATHFACGHERIPENTWYSSRNNLDICRICQTEMDRRYRRNKRARKAQNDTTHRNGAAA